MVKQEPMGATPVADNRGIGGAASTMEGGNPPASSSSDAGNFGSNCARQSFQTNSKTIQRNAKGSKQMSRKSKKYQKNPNRSL